MKCPHCQEEINEGALKCRWCKEFIKADGSARSAGRRPLAAAESERLITMACLIGGGVAFIPIPGTTMMLTGLELLLMGAIASVWGCPLTGTAVTTIMTAMAVRLGLTTALKALAEFLTWVPLVGQVAKPVIAATTVKLVGSGMNSMMEVFYGTDHLAALTAEEAKHKLEDAFAGIREHGSELKDGLVEAFKGNGTPLAATLNKIFGLQAKQPVEQEQPGDGAKADQDATAGQP